MATKLLNLMKIYQRNEIDKLGMVNSIQNTVHFEICSSLYNFSCLPTIQQVGQFLFNFYTFKY